MSSGRSTTISIATSTDYVDTADQESRKVLEEESSELLFDSQCR